MSTTNKTTMMMTQKSFGFSLAGAGALSLLIGCAGMQKSSSTSHEANDSVPTSPDDPMAVVKSKSKQPEVKITEDARADFDKAVGVYQKLKKNGSLKGSDC